MPPLKKTAANNMHLDDGDKPNSTTSTDTPPQTGLPRIALLPAPHLPTSYANAFQTTFQRGEFLLTACVSRQEADAQGPLLTVSPQLCFGMTAESAKRLAAALVQAVNQYERQYGDIDPAPDQDA